MADFLTQGDSSDMLQPDAARAADATPAAAPRYADVWSRTERKYRFRAITFLIVNFLLFCGLCVFTHWLHVARPFEFSLDSYFEPLRFWGAQTQNLNDFVLFPVSVEQVPMHGVVLGLLVASIVAVPISVSILYRFPLALPFAAAVAVFAHMPWMGLTLVGSCILASVRPFRLSFRFGAALVAMLPIILYLYLATRGSAEQVGAYASPDTKLLLAAPWILAILAACVMIGVILLISRLVNYRPGAVGPVMAVMFVTPALIFHFYVGVDEVGYRVLETEWGPRAARFAPLDLSGRLSSLLDEMTPQEKLELFRNPEVLDEMRKRELVRLERELLAAHLSERRSAYESCRAFIADHPESRYVPNVLYMQAWVLDARLKPIRTSPALRREPYGDTSLRRELYSDFPHVQSEEAWLALLAQAPNSPLSAVARLRVAQLRMRRGDMAGALEMLAADAAAEDAASASIASQPAASFWYRNESPEASLALDPKPYLREARRLAEVIRGNTDDPRYGVEPLRELSCLDPQRPEYRTQLLRVRAACPDALLADNLVVLWIASEPVRDRRRELLTAFVATGAEGDALPEALYRLAELELRAGGEDQVALREQGVKRMSDVARKYATTHWGQEAAEQLKLLPSVAAIVEGAGS